LISGVAPAPAQTPATERAIDFLIREVPRWSRENGCFSCHNNGDGARALYAAAARGYRVPDSALADSTRWLRAPAGWDRNRGNPAVSDKKLARIQFAAALSQAPEAGPALAEAAASLLPYQEPDGSWRVDTGGAVGNPVTYGVALATYLSRETLRRAGLGKGAEKADRWLSGAKPANVPDAAALLLASPGRRDCADFLLAAQSSDGGWGPHAMSPSEAFDTALALLALHDHAGPVAKGRAFLISIQQSDGGWPETTRPSGGQSYAQRISTSAWATLALIFTDPKR
jgi:squalene cyclase